MWIVTPLLPGGGDTHYLLISKDYVVGRKNCDILLPSDQSISRAHAVLTATDQTLTVKDTSKYGTFVNSQQLSGNTPVNLKSGDEITFGVFHNKFRVDHQKSVVCSSCLDNDGKASLTQALSALGGKLVNTWTQECTHLVMPTAKVTIKTISALLCCRPIVKPEFFSELSKAAQQKVPPPKAESFLPEIDEPSLSKEDVNLGAIPARKQLFTGKTFVFLSAKQLKRLNAALSFGGGRSQLLEEGSLPKDLLESPQSCVVDATVGSSQTLLSSSATEWANSVKNMVQRKGLRVITESEIGLAAIHASCDKYCNPLGQLSDSEPAAQVKPRIPSASLSQSVAVDETVLPAASQNITAYAANTETTQRTELCDLTGVRAVGETPEKKQTGQLRASKPEGQKTTSQCIVDETMSTSFNTVDNTNSQRKKPESRPPVASSSAVWSEPSRPRPNGGTKTFLQRQSPQKQRGAAQASPQKQSTLTNFFQPKNKKRPLEDELSEEMSEPKRPVLESSFTGKQAPNTPIMSKERNSRLERASAATCLTAAGSAEDLFVGLPEAESPRVSHTVQEELKSRKRKEMVEDIGMDELESIMSLDMDDFDDPPLSNKGQPAQLKTHSSTKQKLDLNPVEASSVSKRPRVYVEDNGANKRPQVKLEKDSSMQIDPLGDRHCNPESSKRPGVSSASTGKERDCFEDDEAFAEVLQQIPEVYQPKEESKTPLEPVKIKQEVQVESRIDEDLPKKLVLVEFRSLTVSAPPTTKPQRVQGNGFTKNFKRFRKMCVPGAQDSPHIIGGSDLLVHNRGKNTDLDEWLKDAAEEERHSKQDQSVGDDLFRYNPTKLTKRR